MLKKILAILILLTAAQIYFPTPTYSQQEEGFYDCQWVDDQCVFRSHDCAEGYGPGEDCSRATDKAYCDSLSFTCDPTDKPPPESCAVEGQVCSETKPCCSSELVCDYKSGRPICLPKGYGQCQREGETCTTTDECCTGTFCYADSFGSTYCERCSNAPYPVPGCEIGGGGGDEDIRDATCDGDPNAIDTAIGCIPINNVAALAGFIIAWTIGIGGGISFLLMLYAGFMIMTSSGDPRRLQAAKELFISAMAGLIMLVFSVFIIRLIGFDILGAFQL